MDKDDEVCLGLWSRPQATAKSREWTSGVTWEVMLLFSASERCVTITHTHIHTHATSVSVPFIHEHSVSCGEPGQHRRTRVDV